LSLRKLVGWSRQQVSKKEKSSIHSFIPFFVSFSFGTIHRAEPGAPDLDYVLREIYILYADCALKDPFYELEMPIRCELFSQAVDALIQKVEKGRR
jgi:hypothetical protein